MKALSQPQVAATISTGGAANEVRVPPIDTFTNSTPSAPYLSHSGMPGRNTWGASISAASVMAAGSVMSEPISGTSARHEPDAYDRSAQRRQPRERVGQGADGFKHRARGGHHHDDEHEQRFGVGARLRVGDRVLRSGHHAIAMATISTKAHSPNTTSTSPAKCSRPAWRG
jgi:hypothetical protein